MKLGVVSTLAVFCATVVLSVVIVVAGAAVLRAGVVLSGAAMGVVEGMI